MVTQRSLGSFARHGTLLTIIGVLSACQSAGLTPSQSSALQASAASPVNSAQRSQHKTTGYYVSELPTLGGTFGTADGINNRNWITGQSGLASGPTHAALWKGKHIQDLGTLGGPNSYVQFPIKSNAGDIAGDSDSNIADPYAENFCGDNVPQTCLPFDWRAGVMTALSTLGGNNGQADGNNSRGDIVGFAETSTKDPSCIAPQVFDVGATMWDRGTGHVTQLPYLSGDIFAGSIAVNDRDDVIGISGPTCGSPSFQLAAHAVLWAKHGLPTSLPTLGGASNNAGLSINNRGDIVGVSDLPGDATYHAVLWKSGQYGKVSDIGTLAGDVSSEANGVNMKGQIVGASIDGSGTSRAVIWENGAIYDLNSLIPSSSKLYLYYGADINDAGMITGDALDQSTGNSVGFVLTPQGGKEQAPTPRQKVALPHHLLEQLVRGSFGRFHLGLIHR